MAFVSLAALLIELHGADGQRYWLNPAEITTAREPPAADLHRHFAQGARCVVLTTDGKFIATRETCDVVRERITQQKDNTP
ncbi:MAG TPA: hypothetical protein VJO13_18965 [Ktedonobacterales bacterium]|nr:hypothetical protein [Ktedonobacterales bacterium]